MENTVLSIFFNFHLAKKKLSVHLSFCPLVYCLVFLSLVSSDSMVVVMLSSFFLCVGLFCVYLCLFFWRTVPLHWMALTSRLLRLSSPLVTMGRVPCCHGDSAATVKLSHSGSLSRQKMRKRKLGSGQNIRTLASCPFTWWRENCFKLTFGFL